MPLPQVNLYPPFNITRLSHIELSVKDIQASEAFYVDTFGMQITEKTSDYLYLRAMEERGHHCLVLKKNNISNKLINIVV